MSTRTEFFTHPTPTVAIRQINGRVSIQPASDDRIEITLTGSQESVARCQIEQRGHEIAVAVGKPRRRFGALVVTRDQVVDILVRIPPSASLQVATVSGDITSDARCIEARFSSVSADMTISGPCTIAALNTVSGDICFNASFAELAGKSVSGDMRITAHGGHSLTVTSVSGDIDIHVLPGIDIDISAKTVSGDLSSQIPLDTQSLDANTGAITSGSTLQITGKTISGDLHVHRAATL